jgi:trans-aconitate 2-methyltransferase
MLLVLPGKGPNNVATLSEKIATSEKWSGFFPIFKQERIYFTLDEYRELLIEADLEVQSIVETESITFYTSKNELINWIKPLINFIDHLTFDHQQQFIEDIADQMLLNNPPLSNGSIGIRHIKLEAVAVKAIPFVKS